MDTQTYYASLIKPSFAPSPEVFGPVWTVLYILIAISFGFVAYKVIKKQLPGAVLVPFVLNLFFNLIYSPIAFGLQSLPLATLDILLVLGSLIWALRKIYSHYSWVTYINIPYLLWAAFATILQISITFLN